jgi:hypothetical protein
VAKGLAFNYEVEILHLLLVPSDQELLESKQEHFELEVNTVKLRELLEATNPKNQELVGHAQEVDVDVPQATMEHFRTLE